ncbi:2697_t:CDS:1, partial [Dentiscutata heterogama]
LTEDFEFHKILLNTKDWFDDEILDKWELINLKFICVANEVVELSEFDDFDDFDIS